MAESAERWKDALRLGVRVGLLSGDAAARAIERVDAAGSSPLAAAQVAEWAGVPPAALESLIEKLDAGSTSTDAPSMGALAGSLLRAGEPDAEATTLRIEPGRPIPDDPTLALPEARATPSTAPARAGLANVPRRLGPYELIEELGQGGMGVVFRARHENLGTSCAVKLLIAGEHASAEAIARFRREAAAVARMGKHPNIVTVHDLAEQEGITYYAMDLVEGESLRKRLSSREYTPEEAALLVEKVARALHFAHGHGIIHRDMKPDNIVVGRDGEPQVMDFGLARDVTSEARLSVTGQVMGTPNYMAPEQARGEVAATDARTDVYALGAVLYEMLTGRMAHDGDTIAQVFVSILRGEIAPPRNLRPGIPKDLEAICLKALARAPAERYSSAGAMADDLHRSLAGETVQARVPDRRPRRLLPAGIAVLLLVCVVVALWMREKTRAPDASVASGTLPRMEAVFFDSRLTPEEKRQRCAGDWATFEKTHGKVPTDLASQADFWALSGWARRLAGFEEEGLEWMRRAGMTDATSPEGPLAEAVVQLSILAERDELRLSKEGDEDAELDGAVAPSPAIVAARKRLQELVALMGGRRSPGPSLDAMKAVLDGNDGLAEAALSGAISDPSKQPFQTTLRFARARVRHLQGDESGALADLQEVAKARSGQAEVPYFIGVVYVAQAMAASSGGADRARLLSEAIASLGEAIRRHPDGVAAYKARALAFARLGTEKKSAKADPRSLHQSAITDYGEVLKRDSGDVLTRYKRGRQSYRLWSLASQKDIDPRASFATAVGDLDEVLNRQPGFGDAFRFRAYAWEILGARLNDKHEDPRESYRRAIADYDAAIRCNPADLDALFGRARRYYYLGKSEKALGGDPEASFDAAITGFSQVLNRTSVSRGEVELSVALNIRGICYLHHGLARAQGKEPREWFEKALADFDSSIAKDPTWGKPHFNKGLVLEELGDLKKAADEFQKSLSLSGSDAESRAHLDAATQRLAASSSATLRQMEAIFYDDRLTPEQRREHCADLWTRWCDDHGTPPAEPASHARYWALSGWARRLAGHEEEGIAWMRKASGVDPSAQDGPLAEAVVELSLIVEAEELPCCKTGGPEVDLPSPGADALLVEAARGRLGKLVERVVGLPAPGSAVKGIKAFLEGDYANSEIHLSRAIADTAMEPYGTTLRLGRARVRYLQGGFRGSIEDLLEAAKARPRQAAIPCFIGIVKLAQAMEASPDGPDRTRLLTEASASLDESIGLDAEAIATYKARAKALAKIGAEREDSGADPRRWFEKAVADFGRVLDRVPDDLTTRFKRGYRYYRLGCCLRERGSDPSAAYEKANEDFSQVIQSEPACGGAFKYRGYVWDCLARGAKDRGDDPRDAWKRSIADLGEALRCDPEDFDALSDRARFCRSLGQAEESLGGDGREWFEAAIAGYDELFLRCAHDQGDVHLDEDHNFRGIAFLAMAKACRSRRKPARAWFEKALPDFDHAIRLDPKFSAPHSNKGDVLEALGRFREALGEFEAVLALSPNDARNKKAIARMQRLLASPWREDAAAATIAIQEGDYSGARILYERALSVVAPDAEKVTADRVVLALASYNLGCIYAVHSTGRTSPASDVQAIAPEEASRLRDLAFRNLMRAIDLGWKDAPQLAKDPDLEPLRTDARWKDLLLRLGG